jgi:cobalt-zinc-cadmium efflux system outer membrane protein
MITKRLAILDAIVVLSVAGCVHAPRLDLTSHAVSSPDAAEIVRLASYREAPEPTATPISPVTAASSNTPEEEIPSSSPLSLTEFEQMALGNNPTLASAQAQIAALHGKWLQVGLRPNPFIGYVGEEIGDEGQAGQQGMLVGKQVIRGNKLAINREIVCSEIEQAMHELAAQRERVLTDVRLAYYDVLVTQHRIDVAEQLHRLSSQTVTTIERLLEAQQATRIELLQAEVEAESASIFVYDALQRHQAAWQRLSAVVGVPQLRSTRVSDDLAEDAPEMVWEETLERIERGSPEIAAALANVQRARWTLERAQVESVPDVDLELAAQYDHATLDTIAAVLVRLPIPVANKNQGGIRQSQAELAVAQREADRIQLDLASRLATVFERYTSARNRAQRYRDVIVPKADETLQLVTTGYQAGELDYLILLTAQRTLFQTRLAELDALGELWAARAQIEGLLLAGSLSTPQ